MFDNIQYLWDALIEGLLAEGLLHQHTTNEYIENASFVDVDNNSYIAIKAPNLISIYQHPRGE